MSESTCHEVGIVTEVRPANRVLVKIRRAEACHSCASKGACTSLGGQTEDVYLEVENTVQATPGDQVTLTLSEASVVKASAVLYLMPALLLLGGAAIGYWLSGIYGWSSDPASLAGSGLGLFTGLLFSRLISAAMGKNPSYIPHLDSIVVSPSTSR